MQIGGGSPIDLLNGNKFQEETDLAALPGVLGLELKRYYNSQSRHAGLLGVGWRMSYETVLFDLGKQIQIVQADGRRLVFRPGAGADAALCSSARPQDGQVRIEEPANEQGRRAYHWRWPDGRTLTFGAGSPGGHPLHAITTAAGERLRLGYAPGGELAHVRDPQGRKLLFVYSAASTTRRRALEAIDTPLGRIRYSQDAEGRLTEAARFASAASAPHAITTYHYEDRYNGGHKNALTGISVRDLDPATGLPVHIRVSTYAYDRAGRAVLSTAGRPRELRSGEAVVDTGIDQIELSFLEKALPVEGRPDPKTGEVRPRQVGKVILSNSLGQTSEVRSAFIGGRVRLLEVRGVACRTCGPGHMRYAYDAHGQLLRATRTDAAGKPLHSEVYAYDSMGRLVREGQLHHAPTARAGTTSVQWTHRFDYRDVTYADGSIAVAALPHRVVRPSVVTGKEHIVQVDRGSAGEVLALTERGHSPLDAHGYPSAEGSPISRTTTYSYESVDNMRVLVAIDGPLPNGPRNDASDSDVTRLHWQPRGQHLSGITHPMNLQVRLERDEATGEVSKHVDPGGLATVFERDADGQVVALRRSRGDQAIDKVSVRRDPFGRVVESIRSAGTATVAGTLQAFDPAGRLSWHADSLGVLRVAAYDTEGRLLRATTQTGEMRQQERYAYDANGRLSSVDDETGARRRLVHDERGRVSAVADTFGRVTTYSYDDTSGLREIDVAANTGKPLEIRLGRDARGRIGDVHARGSDGAGSFRGMRTRVLKDDFGREVLTITDDAAAVLKRYDEADRLRFVREAGGAAVELAYDAAGRITRRTVTPAGGAGDQVTTRHVYEAERLVEVIHPEQRERYRYDSVGRLAERIVSLPLAAGGPAASITRYRYDERHLLVGKSLPDGTELVYERNGQGQIVSLWRRTLPWASDAWGRQMWVGGMERDLVGLRSMAYGNGVAGHWQRSREGVLARIVYRRSEPSASFVLRTAVEQVLPGAHAALVIRAAGAQGAGALRIGIDPQALWDGRLLFDAGGNVAVQVQVARGSGNAAHRTNYLYDEHDQLSQALRETTIAAGTVLTGDATAPPPAAWRYHHDSVGSRLLAQEHRPVPDLAPTMRVEFADTVGARLAGAAADVNGRPRQDERRHYAWNASGQLAEMHAEGKGLARYRYDHRGQRVGKQTEGAAVHYLHDENRQRLAELDGKGRITRQYIWLADQLVGVIDSGEPRIPYKPAGSVHEQLGRMIAAAWHFIAGRPERLAWVHANHLGAPVLMTDKSAKPVWSADYAPFGRRIAQVAPQAGRAQQALRPADSHSMTLDLRLPGHWEDTQSGLYYNDQRYYDPEKGRYLSPDPLGLAGGIHPYAYVGNNPLRFTDPLGRLFKAFHEERWRYITRSGTRGARTGSENPLHRGGASVDIAALLTGQERVVHLNPDLGHFSSAADDAVAPDIDVLGFNRGAAWGRDFANQIVSGTPIGCDRYSDRSGGAPCQHLNFRFMGLWDAVLSAHAATSNLSGPASFDHVAHPVTLNALNEYRALFPLESIREGIETLAAKVRIDRGVLGSHSDIGGGDADGAKVALTWMVNRAESAGVPMLPLDRNLVPSPVMHDKSSQLVKPTGPAPDLLGDDRSIRYGKGAAERQRRASVPGMSHADPAGFIGYDLRPRAVAGADDAEGYLSWLDAHGYELRMTVQ